MSYSILNPSLLSFPCMHLHEEAIVDQGLGGGDSCAVLLSHKAKGPIEDVCAQDSHHRTLRPQVECRIYDDIAQ